MSLQFDSLQVVTQDALASVSIDHGDINLLDGSSIKDLYRCCKQISEDSSLKVVVFQSKNPEIFCSPC